MSRVQMTQAVAADYADAMLVARRAKNVLFSFLTLVLLIQLGVFFVVRYVPQVKIRPEPAISITETTSVTSTSATNNGAIAKWNWPTTLRFWISSSDFIGIVLSMVLPAVLLLIVAIMLVGRLVGVSHVTSAFCWSIVFLVVLFPWQTLLNSHGQETNVPGSVPTARLAASPRSDAPEITLPGVLYTYPELYRDFDFPSKDWKYDWPSIVLKWMRFAGWPGVELIILMMVQAARSRGGCRFCGSWRGGCRAGGCGRA